MRPLRFSINVSLDGCVDHREGTPNAQTHAHAAETIAGADALILGRTMFELMEFWREPPADLPAWMQGFADTMNASRKYLVSSTLEPDGWNTEALRGDVVEAVRDLKREPGRGLYVGGVTLARTLAAAGLIDEYEFVVYPQVVGHGPWLFEGLPTPRALTLTNEVDLGDGIVARRYVPAPG